MKRPTFAALSLALAIGACAPPTTTRTTFPPQGFTPQPVGDATAATRADLITALTSAGFAAADSSRDFRPPEGPLLAAAPRSVLQVQLTNDADHGFIVVYALPSAADAVAAAQDQVAYLGSNTGGRALLPPGTKFVVRPSGATVVYFQWLPATSPDPRTEQVATIIASVTTPLP